MSLLQNVVVRPLQQLACPLLSLPSLSPQTAACQAVLLLVGDVLWIQPARYTA